MKNEFRIDEYLSKGVNRLVREVVSATLKNPAESIFLAKFGKSVIEGNKLREINEKNGFHVPAFLICSITSSCNLHCAGCYARANHACSDSEPVKQLTQEDWKRIFLEAKELGTRFILLAGGEPMIRRDIIKVASEISELVFPIFTNGTMIDGEYVDIFSKFRNLVPVVSIEGHKSGTDLRRGSGVYEKVMNSMEEMNSKGIIYGASVTVTKENYEEVTSKEFLDKLQNRGCKLVFYVEYVPTDSATKNLAIGDNEREQLSKRINELRSQNTEMVYVSFPGDEKSSGGCLAAGRGFFHINSHGGAEPCPFSPYSDINVKETSVRAALESKLFFELTSGDILKDDHDGGCVLFEKRKLVESLLASN